MSEGCSAVKRFGESCPKNNNCTYPQCLIDKTKALQKRVGELSRALESSIMISELMHENNTTLSETGLEWVEEWKQLLKQGD